MEPTAPHRVGGRPRLHFTPPLGWLNDPNGLVFADGEYHLFYQYHPDSLVWGPMHWGHAVSRDLATWEHLPIALAPDAQGTIFSGSAVVDAANTAGFGAGALVAIYTHNQPQRQVQCLAFSTDRGRSWQKYAGNPVLAPADAPRDFRDPRVIWYQGAVGGHWVMALAVGQAVWLYTSPNLKDWTKASEFGAGHGAHSGVWECPELLCLPVDGGPEQRWVLAVGVQQGAPAGGSGTQYFVGSFDGASFSSDDPPGTVRWADYGADFYAVQAWQSAPGGRAIWLAWMNNWDYGRLTPATDWRGSMTAPRELALTRAGARAELVQRLAAELTERWHARTLAHELALAEGATTIEPAAGTTMLLEATLRLAGASATRCGLRLRVGAGEFTAVGYDLARGQVFVERAAGDLALPGFDAPQVAALNPKDGLVRLRILLDASSVEVLAGDGRVTLTSQIFPAPESLGLAAFAEGGTATLAELRAWAPA